jgi:1,2-diacylglycerol 3-beta-galactosyltransferase
MNYNMDIMNSLSSSPGLVSAGRGPSSEKAGHRPRRILLLTADTGGGHRSSAEATQEALLHCFGGEVEVLMADVFRSYLPFPFKNVDWIYPRIIRYSERGWKFCYDLINSPSRSGKFLRLFWPLVRTGIARAIAENKADLIVSFHPMFNYPIQWTKVSTRSAVPVVTIVTDLLSIHAMWCAPGAALYILPTQGAAERCSAFGVPPRRIKVTGLPISLRFSEALRKNKAEVREELGLDAKKPVILLMGGGEGMGMLFKIAKKVASSGPDVQMLVVAGRREELREKLERTDWKTSMKVFGFTRDMPLLMRAADVVVTKAGPSTIAEALAMGLPIILSSYIRGQEDGNRTLIEDCGAGVYEPDPAHIVEILREWFSHRGEGIYLMRSSAGKNGRPDAAINVARSIFEILEKETSR